MSDDTTRRVEELFGEKQFDVESSINMYATSCVYLAAFAIYDENIVETYKDQIRNCHVYLIGLVPKIELAGCAQEGRDLITSYEVAGQRYDLRWPMPPGCLLKGDGETGYYVVDPAGTRSFPGPDATMMRLKAQIEFKVLYIGQAFGESGSRNALDRLRKHETLQKIALKGIPDGYVLTLLMLEILPANRMIMMFNPFAKDTTQGDQRISRALDKLASTSEAEKTTLYEAALIRYFAPPYNKEFKNSFPSTNMKVLAECYSKDIVGVTAEISLDNLPFRLCSGTVAARDSHIAHHDLHKEEDRRVFFTKGLSRSDRKDSKG
jgi:hypothetical protein